MQYRYATDKQDYSDYASGCVFYSAPGHPAFPIRLASEIFQACQAYRVKSGMTSLSVLYDPVCGGAYMLSILAYLHWETIRMVIGSDIDDEILTTAERNLGLLSLEGMAMRIQEIEALYHTYHKQSHSSARESAFRLRGLLKKKIEHHTLQRTVFCADALDAIVLQNEFKDLKADIVIADIPYGIHSQWHIADTTVQNPNGQLLSSLLPILSTGAVVAIAAGKSVKITHPSYNRLERFQSGKRQVVLLSPARNL